MAIRHILAVAKGEQIVAENEPRPKNDQQAAQNVVAIYGVEVSLGYAEIDGEQAVAPSESAAVEEQREVTGELAKVPAVDFAEHSRQIHDLETRSTTHEDEFREVRQRLDELDQQWHQAIKLLSERREHADTAEPRRAAKPATPLISAIVAGVAAAALMLVAGAWYFHKPVESSISSASPRPVAQPQTLPAAPSYASVPPGSSAPLTVTAPVNGNQPSSEHQPPPPPRIVPPVLSATLSRELNNYLHSNRLPFVEALVYATRNGRPTSVNLFGRVRTGLGKDDAALKCKVFFNNLRLPIENDLEVNASLALNPPDSTSAVAELPSASGAANASPGACTDLCRKNGGRCIDRCEEDALGSTTGALGSISTFMAKVGPTTFKAMSCSSQCDSDLDTCISKCGQGDASTQR